MEGGRLELSERDRGMLAGAAGESSRLAMRFVVKMAEVMGAERLLDITGAHIDGCLYHGRAGLDFAERLVAGGGAVSVPTTLNVALLDLLHPELFRGEASLARAARRLMECYELMGCRPTWTCAPYQLPRRPGLGEQVAWAESNAIVFANSVLGARTNRYGDFFDICAAITGRAPAAGLHLDAPRRATMALRLAGVPDGLLASDVLYPVLGHLLGQVAGSRVAVIEGLPAATGEDRLKALGAAAASSGAVAMFHAAGVTPEAPDLETALGGRDPEVTLEVTLEMLRAARDELTTVASGRLGAVSVGTPHASPDEIARIVELLAGRRVAPGVAFYLNTSRDILEEADRWVADLTAAGVELVTDTCTYITPILDPKVRLVVTDSAKWAYYAPGNLGVDVAFGSVEDCVESAVAGEIRRDEGVWGGR